jgi:pimeloyl-ACP methyl ester carboxylesterase
MSAIFLEGEVAHYEVLGRGRPLVFLHSWVGSWRYWIPCMQAASSSYRAYALDLWGYGDSGKNSAYYSLDAQVKLLEDFLEQMGIQRIALVGHGLGALVGLRYAQRHPEVVDRTMAVGYPLGHGQLNQRLRSETPQAVAEALLVRDDLTETVLSDTLKIDSQAMQASLGDLENSDLQQGWRSVENAVLLVYGQNDVLIQTPDGKQLADCPPQAHTMTFDNCGHFLMLDESSKFNRLVLDFLELKSGESPQQLQLKEQWKRRIR